MDPRDFFRGIFGIPRFHRPNDGLGGRGFDDDDDEDLRLPRRREGLLHFDDVDEEEDESGGFGIGPPLDEGEGGAFSVHIYANPLEMEKFFDSQLDQILKGFGFGRGLDGFGAFGGMQLPQPPTSRPRTEGEAQSSSAGSREFMLKEDKRFGGLDSRGNHDVGRKDSDMDEEVEERGLNSILAPPPPRQQRDEGVVPFFGGGGNDGGFGGLIPRIFPGFPEQFGHPSPGRSEPFSSFGSSSSSVTRRVMQLADGSVEERSSARDSDGTERVTVTRRLGDRSHTETTVRRPDGTEERTESGAEDFERAWSERGTTTARDNGPLPDIEVWKRERQSTEESLFDQFFGRGRHPPRH